MVEAQALTLEPEDALHLKKRGLLTDAGNGKRKISQKSFTSGRSLSSFAHDDITVNADNFMEIPTHMESMETLQYLGFSETAAQVFWGKWSDWVEDELAIPRPSLSEYVVMIIEHKVIDAEGEEDDWKGVLEGWGIDNDLCERILDPLYTDVRQTASAKHWVVFTIENRQYKLEEIFQQSRNRLQRRHARRQADPSSSDHYEESDLVEPDREYGPAPGTTF
ncbi:uncharacterized protein KY384_008808 [Bacidia gigantensis]|uniref:uncharacterized protein n=1 Tax=Bacidia gigantensis TaxID=2732470 RepID=UPI001D0577F2|nr:uncharacterized protein KY384_008808 [Bacidia gigantensis]KAG8526607.1 hypothetical protein KY384_008808 [Bacidia gigantensis]